MVQRLDRYQAQGRPQAWLLPDRAQRLDRPAPQGRHSSVEVRRCPVEEVDLALEAPGPERVAEDGEDHERLHAAMERLSVGQREVFELGGLQGLPYGEVAEALGIPVGTVKSRMHHAVRRMRSLLETPGGEA